MREARRDPLVHRYLYKGNHRAFRKIKKNNDNVSKETYDEISTYIDSRYDSLTKAVWRIE